MHENGIEEIIYFTYKLGMGILLEGYQITRLCFVTSRYHELITVVIYGYYKNVLNKTQNKQPSRNWLKS